MADNATNRVSRLKKIGFGPPETGLQIYFIVSVMVLIHRYTVYMLLKSTKTLRK